MSNFIISYDLKKAKNYPAVWNLLERSGAVRLLESLWLLALGDRECQSHWHRMALR
jgi:hypothetical protein